MKKTRALLISTVIAVVALMGSTSHAATQDTTVVVTANLVQPTGTRILNPVNTPAAMIFTDSTTATSGITATVVEALANGVNNWYVTAQSSDFSNVTATFGASNLSLGSLSASEAINVGDLGGDAQAGTSGTLEEAVTMFTVTGETPGAFPGYTGIYTGTGTLSLTVPSGTPAGVYTATVTITLVN